MRLLDDTASGSDPRQTMEALTQAPKPVQLQLFTAFTTPQDGFSRALHIYDTVPVFSLFREKLSKNISIREGESTIQHEKVTWEISPARLKDPKSAIKDGKRAAFDMFPSVREQLIEQVIRKLAVQECATKVRVFNGQTSGQPTIVVSLSLYDIWKELKSAGHEFPYNEIRAALNILAGTRLKVAWERKGVGCVLFDDTIISKPIGVEVFGEAEGKSEVFLLRMHPLASLAIWEQRHYLCNYTEMMRLESALARRIAMLLTLHFRQAAKPLSPFDSAKMGVNGRRAKQPPFYNLTMNILRERAGIEDGKLEPKVARYRLRKRIRAALEELVQNGWITIGKVRADAASEPYNEPVNGFAINDDWDLFETEIFEQTSGRGRRALKDVRWAIFATARFAEEVFADNVEKAKPQAPDSAQRRLKI